MPNEITESEVLEREVELEVFDSVRVAVGAAKERCANIILKYDTPKDIKDAKSFIYDIRLLKAPINEVHKIQCAQMIRDKKACDSLRNKLIGALDEMIEEKYAPIKLIEDAEAKKKADEEAKIQAEEERIEAERLAEIEAQEAELAQKQIELAAEAVCLKAKQDELDRKEREARIAEEIERRVRRDAEEALRVAESHRIDAEEQAAEKLRQAVIDAERDRVAAEGKARMDAANAENARKQAIVDADNAKAAAVQKAKDEAATEAQEKEQAVIEKQRLDRAYALELESQEQERKDDEKHRSQIHRAIYTFYLENTSLGKEICTKLTQALIDGKIPHVKIEY